MEEEQSMSGTQRFLQRMYIRFRIVYIVFYMILVILFSSKFHLNLFMKRLRYWIFQENDIQYIDREKLDWILQENKKGQGVIIMLNHYSGVDPLFLYDYISFYSITKSDLLGEIVNEDDNWLFSYMKDEFFEKLKFISYKRGDKQSGEEVKKKVYEIIQSGKNVIMFPEGTVQHCFHKPLPFKKGIFHLAHEKKIPIFTLSLNYSKDIGLNREESLDIIDIFEKRPDVKIYCNGMYYPQFYSNVDDLYKDVYHSISKNVLLEWK